jgi:hypothetical protein
VFISSDEGSSWNKLTDNSSTAVNPQVPRAKFASFSQNPGSIITFVGTQGRGVWKYLACDAGFTLCSGACVNTLTDQNNGHARLARVAIKAPAPAQQEPSYVAEGTWVAEGRIDAH